MTYSDRLKAARKHAKLKQEELAQRSGISQQTISKIERGKQATSANTVRLATACGVRPEWLATEDPPMVEEKTAKARRLEADRAPYLVLSPEALDVAKAWSKLSILKQQLYRESIFRDAAAETLFPWLRLGRPDKLSYDLFEREIEQDYEQHVKQLQLDF